MSTPPLRLLADNAGQCPGVDGHHQPSGSESDAALIAGDEERAAAGAARLTSRRHRVQGRSPRPEALIAGNLPLVEALTREVARDQLTPTQVERVAYLALAQAAREVEYTSQSAFLSACLPMIGRHVGHQVEALTSVVVVDSADRPSGVVGQDLEVVVGGQTIRVRGLSVDAVVQRIAAGSTEDACAAGRVHPDGVSVATGKRHDLTAREADIIRRIASGMSNREVAADLFLGVNTVKTYIRSAYQTMGVVSRSQAVLWAIRHGLGPDEPAEA